MGQTSSTDRSTICSMKLVYLVVFIMAICALESVQADIKLIEEECEKCKELDGCESQVCVKEGGNNPDGEDLSSECLLCLLDDKENHATDCLLCKSILPLGDVIIKVAKQLQVDGPKYTFMTAIFNYSVFLYYYKFRKLNTSGDEKQPFWRQSKQFG